MKKLISILSIVCLVALIACCFAACDKAAPERIDYVSQVKLDLNNPLLEEVSVKRYVDGDTTHFNVPESIVEGGILKARYLAINTPESTGKIEPYGHKASRFTKEKLSTAVSIMIEPDGDEWKADSTGSRYLTWVWYQPSEGAEYRNLNIEILQEGLAVASNTANNKYGTIAVAALEQAKQFKFNVFSEVADPDMFVGDAIEVGLKDLRCNVENYVGKRVSFDGVVVMLNNNSAYIETLESDPDTGMHYGMPCYYSFSPSPGVLRVLKIGNYVRMIGMVEYYSTAGVYQITDITCDLFEPDKPTNIKRLDDETHEASYQEIDTVKFANQTEVTVHFEDGDSAEISYPKLLLSTSVKANNLNVVSASVTTNEDSSQKGAMTLYCKDALGNSITVRTTVFYDENNNLITKDAYVGKTINIMGIVDYYVPEGKAEEDVKNPYQIKVLAPKYITVVA